MTDLITSLRELIIKAGKIAIEQRSHELIIEYKEDNSPVTNADKAVSKFIYNYLQILTPGILIICEEQPLIMPSTDTFWLIDPIDGTKNYIKGKDSYTINIGLIKNGQPTIGLIYQPAIDKLYYTNSLGNIAIEQYGKTLSINKRQYDDNFIAVVSREKLDRETAHFLKNKLVSQVKYVAGSIKLCLVADGTADIAPNLNHPTMEWDIAAGHSLIKATGGNIVGLDGKQITYGKANFINHKYLACNYRWLNSHLSKDLR